MARKPTDLGPAADGIIVGGLSKGHSPEKVHAALVAAGAPDITVRTVARRMAALRPDVLAGRAARREAVALPPETGAGAALPASPDEIPANASLTELDALRARCRKALDDAEMDGDLKLVGQLIRVASALEDMIRKATPRPAADPNEQPDMVRMGAEVAERLHRMVDLIVDG